MTRGFNKGVEIVTASDFGRLVFELWGKEFAVERLIKASRDLANNETHWLEFKATIGPSKTKQERYNAPNFRKDKLKYVPGDYALHVIKAICAFLNNKTGGILLIGIDDDGNPSDEVRICSSDRHRPVFDEERGSWDTDAWLNWTRLVLGGDDGCWRDRYGATWECSIKLAASNLLSYRTAMYRGAPVVAVLVSPSEDPVYLTQKCCPGSCFDLWKNISSAELADSRMLRVSKLLPEDCRSVQWCGYPHDFPSRAADCYHVMKRVEGTIAADAEWGVCEIARYWQTRTADDFEPLMKRERDSFKRPQALLDSIILIRRRVLNRIGQLLATSSHKLYDPGLKIHMTWNCSDRKIISDVGEVSCSGEVLLRQCANVLLCCDATEAIPVLIELDNLSPAQRDMLQRDNSNFILNLLADSYGRSAISSETWKRLLRRGLVYLAIKYPRDALEVDRERIRWQIEDFLQEFNVSVVSNEKFKFASKGD